jgi:phage-related protein
MAKVVTKTALLLVITTVSESCVEANQSATYAKHGNNLYSHTYNPMRHTTSTKHTERTHSDSQNKRRLAEILSPTEEHEAQNKTKENHLKVNLG